MNVSSIIVTGSKNGVLGGDKHKFIVHVDHVVRTAGRLSLWTGLPVTGRLYLWIASQLPGGDTLPLFEAEGPDGQ